MCQTACCFSNLSETNINFSFDAKLRRYTGHCPTLKFRFGKRYGANTLDIIKELNENGVLNQYNFRNIYDKNCVFRQLAPKPCAEDLKINMDKNEKTSKINQRYILGYTGYIPGMNFQYGKTFCSLAQECEKNMLTKISTERSRNIIERPVRLFPSKIVLDKTNNRLQNTLNKYKKSKDFKDHKVSAELPPITGYTGHIPRLKASHISVSLPFHHSAKLGLSTLKESDLNNSLSQNVCKPFSSSTLKSVATKTI
ncbi:uncharacterized protein LOC126898553 isoform X3 [Daktulosphaira vitifoliae]|uniref:uncharacterized protein LOC126898553 isoform X3 n=1 Tax=Daktulosphaira vitifoliae TaxID=58002 RepID=UPI0021A9AC17|nr:uncharacterized protein LOC126898553 isoform X3 [Daktulosphaira vitifoliae]